MTAAAQQRQRQQQQQQDRAARYQRRQQLPPPPSRQQKQQQRTNQRQQLQHNLKALVADSFRQHTDPQPTPLLHEGQNGFRPGRSCADHQFLLHQMMCGRKAEGKDTFLLFIDTYKAFPTVWLDGLFEKLWQAGVRGKMFRVLHNLYQGAHRVMSYEGCTTDAFSCDLGLHEGDVISPTLYLFFIDGLLKEVHAKHPGVTLLSPMGIAESVVAAMQADDFVAVCDSAEQARAVANTVYAYSCKWRFRLNSSKSALMHVAAAQSQELSESGIVWNGVSVPVVDKYRYLGLWFENDCSWKYHCEQTLYRAEQVKKRLMPLWKNRHVCVDVKRILLLTLIRPIVEYGSEVWWPSTSRQIELLDKLQTDIVKCAMRCDHENPSSLAVLAEWGLKPMHMWLEERAIEYFFKVLRMPNHRMPKLALGASWSVTGDAGCLQWQERVMGLLQKYGIVHQVAMADGYKCKRHVKQRMAAHFGDEMIVNTVSTSTLEHYLTYVQPSLSSGVSFSAPRPFLSGHCRYPSFGMELLMRVRLQCLAVHARTEKYTRRSNMPGHDTTCPACGRGVESLDHLMFACPASQSARTEMIAGIRSVCDAQALNKLNGLLSRPDSVSKVLELASDDWGSDEMASSVAAYVASFLAKAWGLRNRCKHSGMLYSALPADVLPVNNMLHALVESESAARRGADGNVAMA